MKHIITLFFFINLFFSFSALADSKKEALAVTDRWAKAFNSTSLEGILSLYHSNASLWGTTSPTLRTTSESRRQYFAGPFGAVKKGTISNLKVNIGESVIKVFGATAVHTGSYHFSWKKGGEKSQLIARFSFTLHKVNNVWKIVDHHSSAQPDS